MKVATADRLSFLIDGKAYFSTLYKTLVEARHSIFIAGWDIDSRLALLNDTRERRSMSQLADLLNRIVAARRDLSAYVLAWDFAMIYALEREFLPAFKLGWLTHERVLFHLDDRHPVAASHHQKIVVVDEKIAFVGGMDLTTHRWDTIEHRPSDPRRVDANGDSYLPFHDVQAVVDGEAAQWLGNVFRERWVRATGNSIRPPLRLDRDPWPEDLEPDLRDVAVGIARTSPAFNGYPEIREVEALYLDAIASAQTSLYIENQYLTSYAIGNALKKRLLERDGPEVMILLPMRSSGWLEEQTMDALRKRLLLDLKNSDRDGRFGVYYPLSREDGDIPVYMHAKLLIADDRFVIVGSSNLSNRSMGLDSECNVGIEAGESVTARRAVQSFRDRLLAHHMGVSGEAISAAIRESGSLIRTVDTVSSSGNTLEPFSEELLRVRSPLELNGSLIDPERPVDPNLIIEEFVPEEMREPGVSSITRIVLLVLLMGIAAAAWRWSPLGEYLSFQNLIRWGNSVREHPASLAIVLAAYGIAGLIVFPLTLLIGATALVFQPLTAASYSMAGSLLSGVLLFAVGHLLGRQNVRKLAGNRLNRISKILARRGLFTIFLLRILPVAPYSVINLVTGASHIKFRDYLIGTALGLAPGILLISFFGGQVRSVVQKPGTAGYLILLALVLAGAAIIFASHKFLKRRIVKRQRW